MANETAKSSNWWRWHYAIPVAGFVLGVGFVFGGLFPLPLKWIGFVFRSLGVVVLVVAFVEGVRMSRSDRPMARLRAGLLLAMCSFLLFLPPIVAKRCWTEWAIGQVPVTDDAFDRREHHYIVGSDGRPDYTLLYQSDLSSSEAMDFLKEAFQSRGWTVRDNFKNATTVETSFTRGNETVVCQAAEWNETAAAASGNIGRTVVVVQQEDAPLGAVFLYRIW